MAEFAKNKIYDLKAETELRIELAGADDLSYETVIVHLLSGSAEVFGVPLSQGKSFSWGQGDKIAIFTWYGCQLQVSGLKTGGESEVYIAEETPMMCYVNTHAQLEARRDYAASILSRANNSDVDVDVSGGPYKIFDDISGIPIPLVSGPRIVVCGPSDSGKSALCNYLTSCAVRIGRTPLFVELDPSLGDIGVPGSISVGLVDAHCLSPNHSLQHVHPLSFWYGCRSPTENIPLFQTQMKRLSSAIDQRVASDDTTASAGLIINTASGLDGAAGFEVLISCIRTFRADVVLVLNHDRLTQQLKMAFPPATSPAVTVIKLPRSGGVVNRDMMMRRVLESRKIKEYFYGPKQYPQLPVNEDNNEVGPAPVPSPALKPFLMEIPIDVLKLWRFVDDVNSQRSGGIVPVVGSAQQADPCRLERVATDDKSILHSVAAVVHFAPGEQLGEHMSEEEKEDGEMKIIAAASAAGFVVIQSVDLERNVISLLAPCRGKLPSTNLILGKGVKWMDV